MWPSNFSDSFVFCSRMLCFILQTSECLRWVSLTCNHSVVATVCWNAVISVKNISSCGPQKSTVVVSFLWPTVRCLLRTDRNKKVKPPVSHAPISKETVCRKIHFILAYAETNIKRFPKGVIYRPVLHLHAILVFCAVLCCEIVLADRLYCKKFLWFVFASILQSDHYGKSMHRTITAISHCQHSHNVIHSFRSSTK